MSTSRAGYELIERHETTTPATSRICPETNPTMLAQNDTATHEIQTALLNSVEPKPAAKSHRWRAPTFAVGSAEVNEEKPKVALEKNPSKLMLSFVVHLIPIGISVAIVQLSFRTIYAFDVEDNTTKTIRINDWSIGLNEYLNILQFVAKIHEILMISSLSAVILHFVRCYLISRKGLPFGLLTAGYSVGSVPYIASKEFWSSGFNRIFWLFGFCAAFCTVLANILGPSSAIALLPNLDWWTLNRPFSGQALPVGFKNNQSEQWPLEVSYLQAISPNVNVYSDLACMSDGFLDLRFCPAAGYNEFNAFAKAYGNQDVPAKVIVSDHATNAKRLVESVLLKRTGDDDGAVAISTSISHSMTVVLSSFSQFVKTRNYNVNKVVRPKFEIKEDQAIFQPLVQVQCQPMLLPEFAYFRPNTTIRHTVNSTDINSFSVTGNRESHDWEIPGWLYDYNYNITENVEKHPNATSFANMINVTWVDITNHDSSSASIGAIVITPLVGCTSKNANCTQMAHAHTCTIDARWIGSSPFADPTSNSVVQHNITNLQIFQKSHINSNSLSPYGVSPIINIDSSWGYFLNTPISYANPFKPNTSITAGALGWIISTFINPVPLANTSISTSASKNSNPNLYDFSPAYNLANNESALDTVESLGLASADTIATILSLFVTDGLARIGSSHDWFVAVENYDIGNKTAVNLGYFIGQQLYSAGQSNVTAAEWNEVFPYQLLLQVQRYGYGYGLNTVTVQFGITIILVHTAIAVVFMCWSVYDYVWKGGWTSKAWGSMGEMAALLVNSEKAVELEGAAVGVKRKGTWRQRVRVREVREGHVGVAIGKGEGGLGQVLVARRYR